jgi:hypothetical protein
MNAADFELTIRVPADARFAETIRDLAAHAARYAGGGEQHAERYAATVEQVAVSCLARTATDVEVLVILRRGTGPLEILIACEAPFEPAPRDGRIDVGWTREQGASMCRVAMELA